MDLETLHSDICSTLHSDTAISEQLSNPTLRWTIDPTGLLRPNNRIYVPDVENLWLRVLQYKHDHPISGHFGYNCTLDLRQEFIWLDLRNSIKSYIKSCTTCLCSKSQRHRPYGLLKQLPVPEFPWNSISMDFIEKLPPSSGYDTILVIVDQLTKQSIFVPTVHHHCSHASPAIRTPCLLKARSSVACYLGPWFGIRIIVLPDIRKSLEHETPLYLQLSPQRRWTNQMNESNFGTISPSILQLPTGQLVRSAPHC